MTAFVALSGTSMRRSLKDFSHLVRWALRDKAPVPKSEYETDEWALAMDQSVNELERKDPGALAALCPEILAGQVTPEDLRAAFRKRLLETPGVVTGTRSSETSCDASIYIRPLRYNVRPITDAHFATLRKTATTPDGWPLSQAVDIWRHAREMALGVFYKWEPRPPADWIEARKEWCAFVRETLSRSRTLDTELQVVQACDAGILNADALKAWRHERDRPRKEHDNKPFTYVTVPVWFDDSALKAVEKWMREAPGLVWVEHSFFGEELSRRTGVPYYRNKGLDDQKRRLEDADPRQSAIASIDANKEGRNLQEHWSRMLFTAPQEGADVMQQAIARIHRSGFKGDEVEVWLMLGCIEHWRALNKALEMARVIQETTGAESKLLSAEIDWPDEDEVARWSGGRWR